MKTLHPKGRRRTKPQAPLRGPLPFLSYAKSNPSPILIANQEGLIQYVNPAWEKLTGYSKQRVVGKNPRFMSSGKTPRTLYPILWENLRAGKSFESEEFINKRKNGEEFAVRATFFPVRWEKTYFIQVLQDVSHRKKIEKRKDAFIGTASHEIRTPITIITLYLSLLRENITDASTRTQELIDGIASELQRLTHLVLELLDITKMHADIRLHKKTGDLHHVIETVVKNLSLTSITHKIIFEKDASGLTLTYDEDHIAEVLTNLITNAIKYSPKADRVMVRVTTEGGAAVVSVQDFGIGIAPEDRKKIFDLFYRTKNAEETTGFGIGLFIAAQIIAAHDGRLWVTSDVGKGSTFHFSLPL